MDSFEKIQYVIATTLKVSPDKITKETSDKDLRPGIRSLT